VTLTPMRSIRAKCPVIRCALYPYRNGHRPKLPPEGPPTCGVEDGSTEGHLDTPEEDEDENTPENMGGTATETAPDAAAGEHVA